MREVCAMQYGAKSLSLRRLPSIKSKPDTAFNHNLPSPYVADAKAGI